MGGQSGGKNYENPESDIFNLMNVISAAEPTVFKKEIPSAKETLTKKITDIISMFEKGNYGEGLNVLENDVAPKLADPRPTPLADPRPTPHASWLEKYPEGSHNQQLVSSFAKESLSIIQTVQKSIRLRRRR